MRLLLYPTLITSLWLCPTFASLPAWADPATPPLPALTQCLAARQDFPIGRAFYQHFFGMSEHTTDGLAEFCLSFVQDPRGTEHAITWLTRAAHKGLPDAQLLLGSGYEAGRRVESDPKLARYWYEQAAYHNLPHAQFELASIYYSGQRLDLPQDFQRALFWNTLALNGDFPPARGLHDILLQLVSPQDKEQIKILVQQWTHTHVP